MEDLETPFSREIHRDLIVFLPLMTKGEMKPEFNLGYVSIVDGKRVEINMAIQVESHKTQESIHFNEIWRDAPGWEGLYQVSNIGRVRSTVKGKNRILAQFLSGSKSKYYHVAFCRDGEKYAKSVHKLVATIFIGHPENDEMTVDHINNDRFDNVFTNLQWVTREENSSKGWKDRKAEILTRRNP